MALTANRPVHGAIQDKLLNQTDVKYAREMFDTAQIVLAFYSLRTNTEIRPKLFSLSN